VVSVHSFQQLHALPSPCKKGVPPVDAEELRFLIGAVRAGGLVGSLQEAMFARVLRLANSRVAELMTFRSEIKWLDAN
jgi:CBS domain containing-hemolysin-like protein